MITLRARAPVSELAVVLAAAALLAFAALAASGCSVMRSSSVIEACNMSEGAIARAVQLSTTPTLVLAAGGDVMFDRGVRSIVGRRGSGWPLGAVAHVFRGADLGFVNLETALSNRGERLPGKGIWFRSDPSFGGILCDAGIGVVSLANNHALDYGREAFADTVRTLDAAGVARCGGGLTITEACKPAIVQRNGITLAFLAYSELAPVFWSWTNPQTFIAGKNYPGIPGWNTRQILEDIKHAKQVADHVIVSFHWGDEYVRKPAERQMELGRAAIDAGASVVLGHHPHVLQPVELYGSGVIFYSLGNFVFDQRKEAMQQSMIARIVFTSEFVEAAQVIPVRIEDCRPRPLNSWAAKAAVAKMDAGSTALGTRVVFAAGRGHVMGGSIGGALLRSLEHLY